MGLAYPALIDRHVEVDADKHGLAAKFQVGEFFNHRSAPNLSVKS
jgi:hypothetical protein